MEKRGKRGNFHCTWEKKYIFLKKGGGEKISYFRQKYTPVFLPVKDNEKSAVFPNIESEIDFVIFSYNIFSPKHGMVIHFLKNRTNIRNTALNML